MRRRRMFPAWIDHLTYSTPRWALAIGFLLAMGPGTTARADFFANAGAGSPLAYYFLGGDGSTGATAYSSTDYTNGISTFYSVGSSSADLATGILTAYASADYGYNPGGLPNDPTDQFGNSSFGDGLTFLGNFTGQTVTFQISVNGTWSGDTPNFNASDFQFMVLPAGTIAENSGNTLNIFNNPDNNAIVNNTYSLTPTSAGVSADITVTLNDYDPTIEFAANLNINPFSALGEAFDADYTATISVQAPAGVSFISDSGVFAGSVPEPSSLALALAGLASGGLFSLFRSRRNRR